MNETTKREYTQSIEVSNYEYSPNRYQLSARIPLTAGQAYHIAISPEYQALGQDVMGQNYANDQKEDGDESSWDQITREDAENCDTLDEFAEWGPFELWIDITEDHAEDIRS